MTDSSWTRAGVTTVLAGSPLRVFRLAPAGRRVLDSIEAGEFLDRSPAVDRLTARLLDAGAIHPAPDAAAELTGLDPSAVTVVTPQFGGTVAADGRITVDDGSVPALADASLRLPVNVGPAGARNAARPLIETPFVLFIDADVTVPELDPTHPGHHSWWANLLAHFDDPSVGLAAPRVVGDADSSLDLGDEPARIRAGTRVGYVPGAALLVRTEAFDDVGGFDPTLRAGEDVDFVWRLDQAGWRCRYEPASLVRHRPRATWRERLDQQVKYGSSSGPLARRHPGALVPARVGGWSAAVAASAGLGALPVATLVAGASALHLRRRVPELESDAAVRIAFDGHAATLRQLAAAVRRAWWPLAVPFLWSRHVRRMLALSFLASPRRIVLDVAFSVGLWRSVVRSRDLGPIRPARG